MRKPPQMLLCAMVLLSTFAVIPLFFNHEPTMSPKSITVATIHQCEWQEENFGKLTGVDFVGWLHSNEVAGLSLGQSFYFMLSYPHMLPSAVSDTNLPTVKDGWGTPVVFVWSNTADSKLSSKLRKERLPVFVWSAGPNKTNENGYGDDVLP